MKTPRPVLKKIHEIGVTIYPDNKDFDTGLEHVEDFYSSDLDDSDDKYVNENFREGDKSTDAVLCCAMCFTPVCYQCKSIGDSFSSRGAVNVYIDQQDCDSSNDVQTSESSDTPGSNKRKYQKNVKDSGRTARCNECNNIIAFLDDSNNYIFKDVIASQP